ncbi:DUF4333 domain-containing protein [Rhodococcus sp. NPDC047139]|uniref:DUF4333 domain-containing protein n=1 Tax=Rhodococcus sp. NPDC047139 TaxID=3155141 RepID=UPI0034018D14
MTGPNEPQDSPGQTPPEPTESWAPRPGSGGGEQPASPWAPPHGAQPWAPGSGSGAGTGWGQQQPADPPQQQPQQSQGWGPATGRGGQPNPWAAQPGASHPQGWGPAPQQQPPGWGAPPPGWGQQPPGGPQPWGAPGQPAQPAPGWGGQQPGPQNWDAPAGPWPPQPGTAPQPGGKSKLPWILGGAGAVLVLVVVGVIAATTLGGKVLDTDSTQAGVAQVLTESYGAGQVGDVQCPSDQKVEVGHSFTCSVTVDGQFREVTVTVTDDDGTYEVGRPN